MEVTDDLLLRFLDGEYIRGKLNGETIRGGLDLAPILFESDQLRQRLGALIHLTPNEEHRRAREQRFEFFQEYVAERRRWLLAAFPPLPPDPPPEGIRQCSRQ